MSQSKFYLWNIGCQMNLADARRLAEALEARNYTETRDPELANLLILNTCVVRQRAEDKVIGRLSSLRSLMEGPTKRALLVMGCFVDDISAQRARFPYVDAFFGPSDISGVLDFVERWDGAATPASGVDTEANVTELVPISYGCDHHCTYCVVALRRGPGRSRPLSDVVAEVRGLVQRGAREVTLLGQNVDAYGPDLPGQPDLADILQAIHDIQELWRIRFLTSHPREMTQHIIDTVAALPKVCECWELAVQSGDNTVLRRMARGYTVERFRDLIRRIRVATPECAVSTDVIVGFPGETREQFENTLRLVRETRFDMVHIASYSPRPGTVAADWPDDVPPEEKERRRTLLESAQSTIAKEINSQYLHRQVEILVDGRQRGRWRGRTRSNKLVFFESDKDWRGRMAQVDIQWTGPWSMIGEVRGSID